eukprot:g76103.t1
MHFDKEGRNLPSHVTPFLCYPPTDRVFHSYNFGSSPSVEPTYGSPLLFPESGLRRKSRGLNNGTGSLNGRERRGCPSIILALSTVLRFQNFLKFPKQQRRMHQNGELLLVLVSLFHDRTWFAKNSIEKRCGEVSIVQQKHEGPA